ncbi:MAG TPA: biotin transporter BioY [Candidatus Polarisedimenticolia bacterium]|nr:biotin transporter BioY [Candidatus Polarisedimenticolia bacterium]
MARTGPAASPVEVSDILLFLGKTLGFALILAASSKVQLPVPGSPVPATLQTLAVILAGSILGPWGGMASVATYLAAGVASAPVFAFGGGPAYLMGPTGGYLLGYLPGAWVAGFLTRDQQAFWRLFGGFAAAIAIIHLFGWAQLAALAEPAAAFQKGVLPFIALDMLKAILAAFLVTRWRSRRAA